MSKNARVKPTKSVSRAHTRKGLFLIPIAVIVIAIFVFLHFYNGYNEDVLYSERLSQMKEVTIELFSNIENVTEDKWNLTEMQCNFIVEEKPQTIEEFITFMEKQTELSKLEDTKSSLIAVDSSGMYYTETGRKGFLSEKRYLLSEPERLSFVSNSMFGNKSEMVFLIRLDNPIVIQNGDKKSTITYYGTTQNMSELTPYFNCKAYGGNNGMYVLDEHGLKIFGASQYNGLQSFNVFSVLGQMDYLHNLSFEKTKAVLDEEGMAFSNVIYNGEEFYYALYKMNNADWILLLTVPSQYVATNTVELVNSASRTILMFSIIMMIVCAALIIWILTSQQKVALEAERKNSSELAELNVKLESANRAKTEFLSNMSHDIRTPMNAIVGITNLMEHEENDPEKIDEYIHKVQSSSRHLLSLINDVLDMSRIESGKVILNTEAVSLAEQIGQVESIIRPQTNEKKQNFVVRAHNIVHEHLIGDATRLRQVFINLLSNATKYTQEGGDILFDLEELPSEEKGKAKFRFIILDNGYGMSQEFLEHIFEPFTRAENSTTNKVQGTGLGMAITKSIIDLMGGTLSIKSEVNKGSRFTVDISFEIDENTKDELPFQNILLVSDEETFIENSRSLFAKPKLKLFVARNEKEVDEILQNNTIELALLSGHLQGKKLLDNLSRLKKVTKDVILIYCCEYMEQEQVHELVANGKVDGLIIRPLFISNLCRTVSRIHSDVVAANDNKKSFFNGMRFLCAEDNALNAEILKAILDINGATCTIYENGKLLVDAFASVKPDEYDAILMDVQMPVMNGLDATVAIRQSENKLGRTIPIIAMTANAFSEDVQNCLNAGMDAHVAKPLEIATLERALKKFKKDKS